VYCLLLTINTSMLAMNDGFRVSTNSWPYQSVVEVARAPKLPTRDAINPARHPKKNRTTNRAASLEESGDNLPVVAFPKLLISARTRLRRAS
jgi:hypothetical protein